MPQPIREDEPTPPTNLYWSPSLAAQVPVTDEWAPGLISHRPNDIRSALELLESGWDARDALRADARRLVAEPLQDGQCPNCPTDLATTQAGFTRCPECGWSSDPARLPHVLELGDELAHAVLEWIVPEATVSDVERVERAVQAWRADR